MHLENRRDLCFAAQHPHETRTFADSLQYQTATPGRVLLPKRNRHLFSNILNSSGQKKWKFKRLDVEAHKTFISIQFQNIILGFRNSRASTHGCGWKWKSFLNTFGEPSPA